MQDEFSVNLFVNKYVQCLKYASPCVNLPKLETSYLF